MEGNERNRDNLKNWLLGHYKSSTFNTCPHQPLPMMNTPPVAIMLRPDFKPVVHHISRQVALHHRNEVYKQLMQDVALGVIEPVPLGVEVTNCFQMVIMRKSDGSPRRTVDYQGVLHCKTVFTVDYHSRVVMLLVGARSPMH